MRLSANDELILDPNIRDWVVLPMVLLMILMGLTRNGVSVLLKSDDVSVDPSEIKNKQVLGRAIKLRSNGSCLRPSAFHVRQVGILWV